jgi:hypothetical protein
MAGGLSGRATGRRERPIYRAECRTVRFHVRFPGTTGNVGHDDPPPRGSARPFSRYRASLWRQATGPRSGSLICGSKKPENAVSCALQGSPETRLNKSCIRFRAATGYGVSRESHPVDIQHRPVWPGLLQARRSSASPSGGSAANWRAYSGRPHIRGNRQ